MTRMRTLSTLVAVLALVPAQGALATPVAAASANALQVVVVDAAGRAMASSRVLVSMTWPTTALWQQHGRSVDTQATTDASGVASFVVGATDEQKEAAAANGGWLNFIVTSIDPSGRPGRSAAVSKYLGTQADQLAEVAPEAQPGAKLMLSAGAPSAGAGSMVDSGIQPNYNQCVNFHWEVYQTTWDYTRMGDLNSAGDTPVANYEYGTSSDITIDVGFYDQGVGWYVSGTAHSGESIGSLYGLFRGSNFHWGVYAPMNYNELFLYADCSEGSHLFQGHAVSEEDGYYTPRNLTYSIALTQPARDKTHTTWSLQSGPRTGYTRQSSAFKKFGAAVNAFGVSLGAQSGATINSDEHWEFGSGQQWHYIYGIGGSYTTAKTLYASNS